MSEPTGFIASLTPEQLARVLAYDGPETHGDDAFRLRMFRGWSEDVWTDRLKLRGYPDHAARLIAAFLVGRADAPRWEKLMGKPLEWREARVSNRWQRETADTIFGAYEALEWSDGTFGGSVPSADRHEPNKEFSCPSLDAAKAICQADFEQRFLSGE